MKAGSNELKYLFSQFDVGSDAQALLFQEGYCKMANFAGLGEDRKEVKEVLKDDFGIDYSASIKQRLEVSNLLVAWDAARHDVQHEAESRAEAKRSIFRCHW